MRYARCGDGEPVGRMPLLWMGTIERSRHFQGSTQAAVDYNSTIIGALELSERKWVLAVQLPGVDRHSRHVLDACGDKLVSFVERLKARCASAGRKVARVILTHEAGRDGFWLARFLARRGIEVHVMQPSSLPVDRRARRAKTDKIDVEMLLRALMAWLRGEPRVCSMVPIPSEADEEARRANREREDLTRRSIVNKIDGILATLGVKGYKALRRDRRGQLDCARQPARATAVAQHPHRKSSFHTTSVELTPSTSCRRMSAICAKLPLTTYIADRDGPTETEFSPSPLGPDAPRRLG